MTNDPLSLAERTKYIYEALLKGDRINLRTEERKPTYQPCEVVSSSRRLKCIIKNISPGGAMLAGFDLDNIDEGNLKLLSFAGAPKRFEIVWRETDLVGVRFVQ